MQARKRAVANGSPGPVELVDGIAVLHAHALIDLDQLMTLRLCETWLHRVRRAHGLNDAGAGGLWAAILSGQGGVRRWMAPITHPDRRTAGDMAWWRICQIHNAFAEANALECLALVMSVAAGEHRPTDRVELVALHTGLDMVAELIRRGRVRQIPPQRRPKSTVEDRPA